MSDLSEVEYSSKKSKKSKKSKRNRSPVDSSASDSEAAKNSSSKKSKKRGKHSSPPPSVSEKPVEQKSPGEASLESGELSESELVKKRAELLKELQKDA